MSEAVRLVEKYLREINSYPFKIQSVINRENDYEFTISELNAINEKIEYKLYVDKKYNGKIYNAFDEVIN